MSKAYLILSDGTVYPGERFGAAADATGELVFDTDVVGYIEGLTDPRYYGQIVLQTFPALGNYGIIEEDFDGPCALRGYVVREWCPEPSNFRSQYTLDAFLKKKGIPGLCGIDTRAVTQHIRDHGVMNAMIADRMPEDLEPLKGYAVTGGVAALGAKECRLCPAEAPGGLRVALIDYGTRPSLAKALLERGCDVTVLPPATPAEAILKEGFDGVLLSPGPGDPAENADCISQIRQLLGRVPMMGLGLGHQMMALAAGGRTFKLKYGHRGSNHPVIDRATGFAYITGQNHGYAVDGEHLPAGAVVRFTHLNDGTCQGLDYPDLRAFSVQFTPAPGAAGRDTDELFDRFAEMMKGGRE